jgi:hypothetical protein
MDVVYKLWESSWADDAVKHDISKPLYTDPERVKEINHKGEVRGWQTDSVRSADASA